MGGIRFYGLIVATLMASHGDAQDGEAGAKAANAQVEAATAVFRATQLNLRLELPDGERRFRATVLKRSDDELLVLTAGHCLSKKDELREIEVMHGERAVLAVVRRVVRNPSFETAPDDAIPGADNSLALIEVRPADEEERAILESWQPAPLVMNRLLSVNGDVVRVAMIDQFDNGHVLRAANYGNPKWLEWGMVYQPIPGDSGSGVFATLRDTRCVPRAYVVGVVTDRSPTGGGASLLYAREGWLSEGLRELQAAMEPPGGAGK